MSHADFTRRFNEADLALIRLQAKPDDVELMERAMEAVMRLASAGFQWMTYCRRPTTLPPLAMPMGGGFAAERAAVSAPLPPQEGGQDR